jgi:hypothetical protein
LALEVTKAFPFDFIPSKLSNAMIREDRQLVTDEPVEFEK